MLLLRFELVTSSMQCHAPTARPSSSLLTLREAHSLSRHVDVELCPFPRLLVMIHTYWLPTLKDWQHFACCSWIFLSFCSSITCLLNRLYMLLSWVRQTNQFMQQIISLHILQVMDYFDIDVAEYLYKTKPDLESLKSFLCKDLTKVCSKAPPPVPKVMSSFMTLRFYRKFVQHPNLYAFLVLLHVLWPHGIWFCKQYST